MLNRHKPTLKTSFLAILLAMMAWTVIGVFGRGASGNNHSATSPFGSHLNQQLPSGANPKQQLHAVVGLTPTPDQCELTSDSGELPRTLQYSLVNDLGRSSRSEICELPTSTTRQIRRDRCSTERQQAHSSVKLEQYFKKFASLAEADLVSGDARAHLLSFDQGYDSDNTPHSSALGTCTVTTPADSGAESLRQCLSDIGTNGTITFDPVVFSTTIPTTITLESALPPIRNSGITIDGSDAGVVIDGNQLTNSSGLVINGVQNVAIKGLQLINFDGYGVVLQNGASNNVIGGPNAGDRNIISGNQKAGILIWHEETSNNYVQGNYIGTDASGQVSLGNQEAGIILDKAHNNIIGGAGLAGNVIGGNTDVGILMQFEGTRENQVLGNYIGTTADGMSALGNGCVGIGIIDGADENIIGAADAGNVISGNGQTGIDIRHSGTENNQVLANYIGTDKTGTAALDDQRWGVAILCEAHHNTVGNGTVEGRNIISGHSQSGVQLQDKAANNQVLGNYIGTDKNGSVRLSNRWGIDILLGPKNNTIGGQTAGEGNLISGNAESGIELASYFSFSTGEFFDTTDNQVQGNLIGTAADGTSPLGNGFAGVCLFLGANSNTIGPGNTIAHNADAGVRIQNDLILIEPVGNTITQNAIHQNNRLPIDFIDPPLLFNPAPTPPTLSNWLGNVVSGTACANCQIEIFANPEEAPAGTDFLVAGNADGLGNFTITLPSDAPTDLSCLSATATDQAGTTSEFSDSLCVESTPTVTNTPSATPTATNTPSATPTVAVSQTATPTISNDPTKVTPTATPVIATPTATSVTATPTATSVTATPTATSVTATPTATSVTATPTATPVTATPTATQTPSSSQLYLPLVLR